MGFRSHTSKTRLTHALVLATFLFLLAGAMGVALAAPGTPAPGSATAAIVTGGATSVDQQIADRYAPVAYLRRQTHPCAAPPNGGEPYLPLPVEMVLNNPRVSIRDGAAGDKVVASHVSAQQLATFGPQTYMDFPGDPRRPGCTYERDERERINALGLKPTTYVHVIFDPFKQRLALQYWFYWYFNDWNNTHESDWEGIQLMWDHLSTLDKALRVPPTRVGFAQHDGGELGSWDNPKLELENGTHLRVYPAAGSHATFFSNHTFLGYGGGAGFGCDVSSPPSVRTPLQAVLLPDQPDPNGEFAWLLYQGRWGERQPSVFNGPLGPAYNGRWSDPWGTADSWRTTSIVVPQSSFLGPNTTDAFCGLTEAGSQLLILTVVHPWVTLPVVAVIVAAFAFFYRRSRPLFQRAIRLYGSHWRVFVGIGLVAVPIGIVFNILEEFLIHREPLRFVVSWLDDTAGARLSAVALIGGVQQLAMLLIISPAVIQAVADIQNGVKPEVRRSYQLAASRSLAITGAFIAILLMAGIPLLLVFGIPIAIWLVVRWQFFVQALIFDNRCSSIKSLETSARLVRGQWWKTLFAVLIFDLLATAPGIIVGLGLLTLGRTAVGFANGVSSVLYSLTIPLAVMAVTLLYLDRKDASLQSNAPPRESGS